MATGAGLVALSGAVRERIMALSWRVLFLRRLGAIRPLKLSTSKGIVPGAMVRLVEHDYNGSLGRYLHAGYADAGTCLMDATEGKFIDFASKVKAVSGTTITLERPLRADVRLNWQPEIFSYAPTLQEIGMRT